MQTINLSLKSKFSNYDILIGEALTSQPIDIIQENSYNNVAIISNVRVMEHYQEELLCSLQASKFKGQIITIEVGDGESFKSFESYLKIMDTLIDNGFRRNDLIIAIGGGVVGDIAGFTAATYQRGMDFIQVPTSLLAMVDSSVGGKTAVNHPQGKNMIGAFHQPKQVRIDTSCLKTLDTEQFNAGMAEIIKIAAIYDKEFFEWLELNASAVRSLNPSTLEYMISRSCTLKAEIVEKDELEQGIRAILNFGHTFGHAIESVMGYGKILHGEAVAIGMVLATRFVEKIGDLSNSLSSRLIDLLIKFDLPTSLPEGIKVEEMVQSMMKDKKNLNTNIRLILLSEIGKATIQQFDSKALTIFLEDYD